MKIGIDISPIYKDQAGIGNYAKNLTQALLNLDLKNEYFLYYFGQKPRFLPKRNNIHWIMIPFSQVLPFKGIRWIRRVARHAKAKDLDLFLSYSYQLFSLVFPRTFQFIHDLSPIKLPRYYSPKTSSVYKFTTKIAASRALHLVTISKTMQKELSTYANLPENRLSFIYPGLSNILKNSDKKGTNKAYEKIKLTANYLLTVSTLEPKKNIHTLIKAFLYFKKYNLSDYKLVIVGKKGWGYQELFQAVRKDTAEKEILFLDYVPDLELKKLYQKAKIYINISKYEGFGMTPMEALYFNIPTILSDIPVFKECYNGLVKFVDFQDIKQIAAAIKEYTDNPRKKNTKDFIVKLYSWEKSAHKLLKIFSKYARKN